MIGHGEELIGPDGELIVAAESDNHRLGANTPVFLLNPANQDFIKGEAYAPQFVEVDQGRGISGQELTELLVIPALGWAIVLSVIAIWFLNTPNLAARDSGILTLLIGLIVVLTLLSTIAFSSHLVVKRRRKAMHSYLLTRRSRLLYGEIVAFYPHMSDSHEYALLTYSFVTPNDKRLYGKEKIIREALKDAMIRRIQPKPGRAVAVMYVNDRLYRLL